MRLIFLGSGSAFTVGADNYQSNMLLEDEKDRNLLIDCGSDVRLSLYEAGMTYEAIDSVYISHLHADHVGGMEWLGITRYFSPTCALPKLYIYDKLIDDLWNKVLSGGLSTIEEVLPDLHTFFKVHPIAENSYFTWSGIKFHIIRTVHVISEYINTPSHGLFFEINGVKIFITTDTKFFLPPLMTYYERADIIFQDCETSEIRSGVHAHYSDLVTLSPDLKQKIWLYHYNPGLLPDAKKDGFRGFVKKGQCFDL